MSGQCFAKHHGIKYTTFSNWRQKQRKQSSYVNSAHPASEALINSLVEVTPSFTRSPSITSSQETHRDGLQVHLKNNVKMTLTTSSEVALAALLIKQLQD
jgi:hypothetical protein